MIFYILNFSLLILLSYGNSQLFVSFKDFDAIFPHEPKALHDTVAGDLHLYMRNMVCKRQDEGCHSQGASRNEFIVEK